MESEIRYCTAKDGVRIAYAIEGDGPPLVVCSYIIGSFTLVHLFPELQKLQSAISAGRRVLSYDLRGTGASERHAADFSHDAMVGDLEAVIAASKFERFYMYAATTTTPLAIHYAATHPDRVLGLVLYRPFTRTRDILSAPAVEAIAALAKSDWESAARVIAGVSTRRSQMTNPVAVAPALDVGEYLFQSTSGEIAASLLTQLYATTDVAALLPNVTVPTLVLDRESADAPEWVASVNALAATLPDARLSRLRDHPLNDPAGLARGMDSLVPRMQVLARADAMRTSFQTVLFTDLVGHTEMMQRLGDAKGRDVLRDHERITRDLLSQYGGAEVKTMGDGFMASFGSVTKAVDCAIGLQRAFASHTESMPEPLHVRVGLNAGEPIEEDGDLFGSTVILASRIAAKAGAGEILIPEPLRHLLSGKSYVYADRGETMLKGFEDALRLYEVRWRD